MDINTILCTCWYPLSSTPTFKPKQRKYWTFQEVLKVLSRVPSAFQGSSIGWEVRLASAFPGFSTHLSADIDTINSVAQIPGNADKRLQNTLACLLFQQRSMYGTDAHVCTCAKTTEEGSQSYRKAMGEFGTGVTPQYSFQPWKYTCNNCFYLRIWNKRTVEWTQPDQQCQIVAVCKFTRYDLYLPSPTPTLFPP